MAVFKPTNCTLEPGSKISSIPSPAAAMDAAEAWSAPAPAAEEPTPPDASFRVLGVKPVLGSRFSFVEAKLPDGSIGIRFSCFTRKSCPLSVALTSKRCVSSWHSTTRPRHPLSSTWFRSPRIATCVPTASGVPLGATGTTCSAPFTFSVSASGVTRLELINTSNLSFFTFVSVPTSPLKACCLPFKPTSTTCCPSCNPWMDAVGEGTDSGASSSVGSTSTW
mmetsp:Transcript_112585/g.313182  ORF Transcript_112585/g.313182 Transcript_112585/m.313182 type:complete len:222 (+) Transcript_112585:293-958(+)